MDLVLVWICFKDKWDRLPGWYVGAHGRTSGVACPSPPLIVWRLVMTRLQLMGGLCHDVLVSACGVVRICNSSISRNLNIFIIIIMVLHHTLLVMVHDGMLLL
jgi:hypothetical protein